MLNKYFIAQITENTTPTPFNTGKKSKQEYRTTLLRMKLNWKLASCFYKPAPIFFDAEMNVLGNIIVLFSKYVYEID